MIIADKSTIPADKDVRIQKNDYRLFISDYRQKPMINQWCVLINIFSEENKKTRYWYFALGVHTNMSTLIKRIHDTPCKVSYISIQINKMRVHTNMSTLIKRIHDTPCKVSYISIQIHEVWTHCNFHSSSSASWCS